MARQEPAKSRLIYWIRRLFTEALEWKHGEQFLCVAFQNRVAHAMDGVTLHSAGEVQVGGQSRTCVMPLGQEKKRVHIREERPQDYTRR